MASNIKTITLYVRNMTCVNCENIIERELSQAEGVYSVKASYSAGRVSVTYDEALISPESFTKILAQHDYFAEVFTNNTEMNNRNAVPVKQGGYQEARSANQQAGKTDFSNIIAVAIILFAVYMVANRFGLLNIFNSFPIAKEGMGYGMLFVIGLLTSVHCVAMCGGICLSQCANVKTGDGNPVSKLAALRPSLLYNMGRVISYTVIGGIVGAIGSAVSFSGPLKGMVQLFAGVFMVIMGLNMLNIFPWLRRLNPRMPKIFAKKIYARRNSNSPLYIGLLNGLMPCGPLQAMQLYALSTGSPLKGAVSMFLFSIGTVPLMFAFGALGSLLSKKFTHKMMSVSAVLVVVLGVFMFNNGLSLSGIAFPHFPFVTGQASSGTANVAVIKDGVQEVTTGLSSGRYEPIVVQKGIPVVWTIQAEKGDINGCNNSIIVQKYNIQKRLEAGDNVIKFTPTDSGEVPFSCWMGMIRSKITVVEDLNSVDSSTIADAASGTEGAVGGCCGGASTGYSDSGNTGSGGAASGSTASDDYNPFITGDETGLRISGISADEIAVAKVEGDTQTVDVGFDPDGFSPAVLVVQSGIETQWNINAATETKDINILFPYYNALLQVREGSNPITFIPDQDFDFYTEDGIYSGYVKVVQDINNIDIDAIKAEVSRYDPSASVYNSIGQGVPSCH